MNDKCDDTELTREGDRGKASVDLGSFANLRIDDSSMGGTGN